MSEQQEKYYLPENWAWTKLKNISLRIHYGYTASSTQNDTGIKLLRITDIQNSKVNWKNVPFCNITVSDIEKFKLRENDIVFARTGATVGKSFIIPKNIPQSVFASYLIRIELSKHVNPIYIYYFFQSVYYWRQIGVKARGIGQPNVNASSLSNIDLPICSLNQQNKIVEILEAQLSSLEKCKEQLQDVINQLKIYRQAVLKNAYNGNLTRINFNKNEKLKSLPEGWYSRELSKLVEHKSKRAKPSSQSNLQFIGLDSIEPNTLFPSNIHNFSDYKSSAIFFRKNQVLYGRMRPYLNKIWKADFDGVCSSEFLVLECSSTILPDYLKYKLHSMDFVAFAKERSSGDRPRVSFDKISDFHIPICSIEEQTEIIKIIDHHFSNADKINSWVTESLEKLNVLEKVILKKAFEGKLTLSNNKEESVYNLLESIKKEISVYLSEEIINKKYLQKNVVMDDKHKTILELLKESTTPILSSQLWLTSDKKDDIDGFYAELKKHVEAGDILELPRNGKESLLKLADKNENR